MTPSGLCYFGCCSYDSPIKFKQAEREQESKMERPETYDAKTRELFAESERLQEKSDAINREAIRLARRVDEILKKSEVAIRNSEKFAHLPTREC